jgi:hypothetical protein
MLGPLLGLSRRFRFFPCVLTHVHFQKFKLAGTSALDTETDPHRLAQRQKQIDFGKNTIGYQRYRQMVPK